MEAQSAPVTWKDLKIYSISWPRESRNNFPRFISSLLFPFIIFPLKCILLPLRSSAFHKFILQISLPSSSASSITLSTSCFPHLCQILHFPPSYFLFSFFLHHISPSYYISRQLSVPVSYLNILSLLFSFFNILLLSALPFGSTSDNA